MKVVIDTNVLVSALSSKSMYHWLVQHLLDERFELFVTDEIMLEYEEVLKDNYVNRFDQKFELVVKKNTGRFDPRQIHSLEGYLKWQLRTID